jgi:hypothetical protein
MAKVAVEINEQEVQIKTIIDNLVEDVKELEKEKQTLEQIYLNKVQHLKDLLDEKLMGIDTKIDNAMKDIRVLAEQVELKETKTQKKFEGLNGTIIIKKPSTDFDYDKSKLLDWARENGRLDLIKSKTTEDFTWAEFKKNLVVQEDLTVLDTSTGEMLEIEGLKGITKEEELQIK